MSKSSSQYSVVNRKFQEKKTAAILLAAIIFSAALFSKSPKLIDISAHDAANSLLSAASIFVSATENTEINNSNKNSQPRPGIYQQSQSNPLGVFSLASSGNFLTSHKVTGAQSKISVPDNMLDKIWFLEASRRLNPPAGDGGKAIGPMQLHQCVLDDVNKFYGKNFKSADRINLAKSRRIATLYITMWLTIQKTELSGRNLEEAAVRIFHGGPRGWTSSETDKYYQKYLKLKIED